VIRRLALLVVLVPLAGCGVPVTAGLLGAGLGVVASTEDLDVKLIDLYLSMHGKTVANRGVNPATPICTKAN
jgi:hypothetical protein